MSRRAGVLSLCVLLAAILVFTARSQWSPQSLVRGLTADPADPRTRGLLGASSDEELRREAPGESEPSEPSNYLAFPHRDNLNPQAGTIFVVSFRFHLAAWPGRAERRIRLISKYDAQSTAPFPGWVIAVRPLRTSVRPEVYWQTRSGKGGWYTFDRFELKPQAEYEATLVVKAEEQMSFFLREIAPGGERAPLPEESPVREKGIAHPDGFLGGYALRETGVPQTDERLIFASSATGATVSRLLVAQVENLRLSRKVLSDFVGRGPDGLLGSLRPAEIALDYPPAQPEQAESH